MKVRTLTTLLLTGAVLTCSQNVYADTEHNKESQSILAKMQQLITEFTGMHKDKVSAPVPVATPVTTPTEAVPAPAATPAVAAPVSAAPVVIPAKVLTLEEQKAAETHKLIDDFMTISKKKFPVESEKAEVGLKKAFETDFKNTCLGSLEYMRTNKAIGKGPQLFAYMKLKKSVLGPDATIHLKIQRGIISKDVCGN